MKLVIIITGLVLLAPDRDNGRLHLFLPQMDMSHPKAEHHTPFLRYTSAVGPHRQPLNGWALNLGAVARPGIASALPAQIIRMDSLSGSVPGAWVTGTPSPGVQARLSLPWPDTFHVRKAAMWRLVSGQRDTTVRLTNEVVLEYDSLTLASSGWKLTALDGSNSEKIIPPLRPRRSSSIIRISNVPPRGGAKLKRGDEGVHFQAYVDILLPSTAARSRPRPRLFLDDERKDILGMSPYNCMLASAPID